jgi:hypothetical protein
VPAAIAFEVDRFIVTTCRVPVGVYRQFAVNSAIQLYINSRAGEKQSVENMDRELNFATELDL